jgi:hypothetical protein
MGLKTSVHVHIHKSLAKESSFKKTKTNSMILPKTEPLMGMKYSPAQKVMLFNRIRLCHYTEKSLVQSMRDNVFTFNPHSPYPHQGVTFYDIYNHLIKPDVLKPEWFYTSTPPHRPLTSTQIYDFNGTRVHGHIFFCSVIMAFCDPKKSLGTHLQDIINNLREQRLKINNKIDQMDRTEPIDFNLLNNLLLCQGKEFIENLFLQK